MRPGALRAAGRVHAREVILRRVPAALVVDDNAINRRLLESILGRIGWTAAVCENGTQALAALRERPFDLVLLDLRMPDIGGAEICRRIRNELNLTALPVIAYTAHGMLEDRARMLAEGFNSLLIKPVSFADVKGVCEEFGPLQS